MLPESRSAKPLCVGPVLSRLLEELLPFGAYLRNRRHLQKLLTGDFPEELVAEYRIVPQGELADRLKEEHERARNLDEKTTKMTLAFGLALPILGAAAILTAHLSKYFALTETIGVVVSVIYILIGGLLALSGLRVAQTFGYGTKFRAEKKSAGDPLQYLVEQLLRQETQNTIRQIRNEAAFQCLRNGFGAFGVSLLFYILALYSAQPRAV